MGRKCCYVYLPGCGLFLQDSLFSRQCRRKLWHGSSAMERYFGTSSLIRDGKIHTADLTPAECKSYELLREWWDNDTYDANVTLCIRDWIEQAAQLLLDVDICPRLVTSRYNFVLFTLWPAEFCHDTSTDSTNQQERMRSMSAPEAACHRLASNAVTELQRSWILGPRDESQHFPAITRPAPEELDYVDPPMTAGFQPCSWLARDVDGTG
jgi:hypothetical protein